MAERGATLGTLPFTAGTHDSLASSFFLLGFRDDEDVLYVAGSGGTFTIRNDRELVARYLESSATAQAGAFELCLGDRKVADHLRRLHGGPG